MFSDPVRKADSKLQNWKASSISKAGRVLLIQYNFASLPSHTMQCFKLPKSMSNNLDKINQDFFWKNRTQKKVSLWWPGIKPVAQKSWVDLDFAKLRQSIKHSCKLSWKSLTELNNFGLKLCVQNIL